MSSPKYNQELECSFTATSSDDKSWCCRTECFNVVINKLSLVVGALR